MTVDLSNVLHEYTHIYQVDDLAETVFSLVVDNNYDFYVKTF